MTKRIIASLLCVVIVLAAVPAIFANAESTTSTVSLSDLAAQIAALGSQISSIMGSLRNIQTQTQGNGSQNGQPLIGDPNFAISGIRPLTPGNPGGVISPKGNLFTGKITAISGNTLTLQTNGFQKLTAAATNTANSATVDDSGAKVMENGQAKTLADLAVGQMVMVASSKEESSGTLTATAINIFTVPTANTVSMPGFGKGLGAVKIVANDSLGNGIFDKLVPAAGATDPVTITLIGLSGTVSAISADGKTLTVGTTYSGAPSYAVDATSARIIGALKQKKLSDIKVNDTVTVIGQLTAANTVTANSITDSTQN